MGGSNANVMVQLRQTPTEVLFKKRDFFVRNSRFLKWGIPVLAIAAFVSIFLPRAQTAEPGVFFAVLALLAVARMETKTRIWFIDLVLAERDQKGAV